jgi:hypothetical protein
LRNRAELAKWHKLFRGKDFFQLKPPRIVSIERHLFTKLDFFFVRHTASQANNSGLALRRVTPAPFCGSRPGPRSLIGRAARAPTIYPLVPHFSFDCLALGSVEVSAISLCGLAIWYASLRWRSEGAEHIRRRASREAAMSENKNPAPESVRAAAVVVNAWVTEQEQRKVSDEEFARMSPRERLDYCRKFPQGQFK